MLKYKSQKGFTIVELLIVIVVIGILAALVLNTFSGVQRRARDTQRQTDVNALATQLEVYYNDKGGYPQFSQLDTPAEAKVLFPGLDEGSMLAPNGTAAGGSAHDVQGTTVTTTNLTKYSYVALNGAAACATDNACTSYTLSWVKEDPAPAIFSKKSLN